MARRHHFTLSRGNDDDLYTSTTVYRTVTVRKLRVTHIRTRSGEVEGRTRHGLLRRWICLSVHTFPFFLSELSLARRRRRRLQPLAVDIMAFALWSTRESLAPAFERDVATQLVTLDADYCGFDNDTDTGRPICGWSNLIFESRNFSGIQQ